MHRSAVRRSTDHQYSSRTANYIVLTDCAFLFFRGLQLRVWDPEIECDLPCHEDVFDAVHPFTHPEFSFKRSLTAQQAFNAMFTSVQADSSCDSGLTMLDSFVLIHSTLALMPQNLSSTASTDDISRSVVLYRYASATLTVQLSRSQSAEELQHPYGVITSDMRFALNRWFEEWTKLHKLALSRGEWDALGFYKNGDQYAYATLLLLSSKARPHLRHLLRPNADRLRLLQELNK